MRFRLIKCVCLLHGHSVCVCRPPSPYHVVLHNLSLTLCACQAFLRSSVVAVSSSPNAGGGLLGGNGEGLRIRRGVLLYSSVPLGLFSQICYTLVYVVLRDKLWILLCIPLVSTTVSWRGEAVDEGPISYQLYVEILHFSPILCVTKCLSAGTYVYQQAALVPAHSSDIFHMSKEALS